MCYERSDKMAKRRADGEGNIRQKRPNLWEGRIVAGHKKDGSPIYKYVSGRTQKEAYEKLRELIIEYRNVELTEDSQITVEEWLQKWMDEYMLFSIREQTWKTYESVIRLHIIPNLGNRKVASLTTSVVQKFYNKLLSEGKSGSLVRDAHLILHQAMDVAVKENLVAKNPTNGTKIPKVQYKPKNILNETQLEMFIEAIKKDALWYDFFYTEITTGLRRGELCGLKWCDFNETTGQLNVVRTVTTRKGGGLKTGETKTQKGTRTIYLPPSTVKLLSERRNKVSSEWIFPNLYDNSKPINPSTAYLKLKAILKNAGLPSIRFHDLRHTFATHALSNGVDARTLSGILGHTNASFTLDTYTHVTNDMQKNASAIVGRFMKDITEVS